MGAEGRIGEMMLTLLGSSGNGFHSKLELTTVADDDRSPRAVFFVCRNIHDFRDDVFVSTDHSTEHHVFPCLVESRRPVGASR